MVPPNFLDNRKAGSEEEKVNMVSQPKEKSQHLGSDSPQRHRVISISYDQP